MQVGTKVGQWRQALQWRLVFSTGLRAVPRLSSSLVGIGTISVRLDGAVDLSGKVARTGQVDLPSGEAMNQVGLLSKGAAEQVKV